MGRENTNADQCQTGCEDIHEATLIFVGGTIESALFPEFFVPAENGFVGACEGPGTCRNGKHAVPVRAGTSEGSTRSRAAATDQTGTNPILEPGRPKYSSGFGQRVCDLP